MLQLPRWQIIVILLVLAGGFLSVIPNFFPRETVASWPGFIPKRQVVLGLDLQGGAYLLYEVDKADYVAKRLRAVVSDVRTALLQAPRINYTGLSATGNAVQLRVSDPTRLEDVRKRLEPLRNPLNASLLSGGSVYEFDLVANPDGLVRLTYSEAGLSQRVKQIVAQSKKTELGQKWAEEFRKNLQKASAVKYQAGYKPPPTTTSATSTTG